MVNGFLVSCSVFALVSPNPRLRLGLSYWALSKKRTPWQLSRAQLNARDSISYKSFDNEDIRKPMYLKEAFKRYHRVT